MSNNAVQAYNEGKLPISKITRKELDKHDIAISCVGHMKNRPIHTWMTIQKPATVFFALNEKPAFPKFEWPVFHLDDVADFLVDISSMRYPTSALSRKTIKPRTKAT